MIPSLAKPTHVLYIPVRLSIFPPQKLYTSVIHASDVTVYTSQCAGEQKWTKLDVVFQLKRKQASAFSLLQEHGHHICFLWITGWQFASKDTKHANLCASRSRNYKVVLEKQHKPSKVHTRLIPPPRNSGLRTAWAI